MIPQFVKRLGTYYKINIPMEAGHPIVKLVIPSPDSLSQKSVRRWRNSSFGVNILVDDHQRIFTTSTVLSALFEYEKIV